MSALSPGTRTLRDEILDAAEEILRESGREDALSMRAVAERVGCTAPAIYRHFDDRTALLFETCARLFAALGESVERAAEAVEDPLSELRERGRAYVRFGVEHPEAYRVLFMGNAAVVPAGYDVDELLASGGFGSVVASVERCMRAGAFAPGDPFEVATRCWVAVHGLTSLVISKPWFPWRDLDERFDGLFDTLADGLAGR